MLTRSTRHVGETLASMSAALVRYRADATSADGTDIAACIRAAVSDCGALFIANHSGGKDSQAMLIKLLELVPAQQILVVHASLGEAEWPGALEHAEQQARDAGLPFVVARAAKTIFDMVRHRHATRPEVPSWPSASHRQCTSDLKRGPIEREVRRYAKAHGFSMIVNCLGLRAEESTGRAKRPTFSRNDRASVAGRDCYEWLPIHNLTTDEVKETVRVAGQELHYAYGLGNERLSCVFCIMGSKNDLACGAKHNPALLERYVALESETGYTMHQSRKSLLELVREAAEAAFTPAAAPQAQLSLAL